jgi:hypothetical protein
MGVVVRVDFRGGTVAFEADGAMCVATIRSGGTAMGPDAGPVTHDAGSSDPPTPTGRELRCICDFYCDGDFGGITPEYPAFCSDESRWSIERDQEDTCEADMQVRQWCDLLDASVSGCSCRCEEGAGC